MVSNSQTSSKLLWKYVEESTLPCAAIISKTNIWHAQKYLIIHCNMLHTLFSKINTILDMTLEIIGCSGSYHIGII